MSSKGFNFLLEMFPHVDRTVLLEMCLDIENDEEVDTIVESLLEDYSSGGYNCQVHHGVEVKFLPADSSSEEGVGQAEGLWTQPPTTENTSSLTDWYCCSTSLEGKPVDSLSPSVCIGVEHMTLLENRLENDELDVGQQLCVTSKSSTSSPESEASVSTATPRSEASVLTATPGSEASVLTATPGSEASVLTATPGSEALVLTATPESEASMSTVSTNVTPVLLISVLDCLTETEESNKCTDSDTGSVESCTSEMRERVARTYKSVPCATSHKSAFEPNVMKVNDAQNENELSDVLEDVDDSEPIPDKVRSDCSTSSANLSEEMEVSLVNSDSTLEQVEDFGDHEEESPRVQVEEACNLNVCCDVSVCLSEDVDSGRSESAADIDILPSGQDLNDAVTSDYFVEVSAETSSVHLPLEFAAACLLETNNDFPPELFEVDRDSADTADDYEIARMISEENEAAGGCNDALEDRISFLLNFMPDADPSYLNDICERYGKDEPSLLSFVQEALDSNKYPTFDDYLERQEKFGIIRETLGQITVPMFVNLYSRPFEYFYGSRTKHQSEMAHEFGFVQRRYRNVSDVDLRNVLDKCDHNLTMCCKDLDSWDGPTQHRRGDWECHSPQDLDMSFIHEVFFIENERAIIEHLELESFRGNVLERVKFMEAKFECPICCEDELEIVEMAACAEGHLFCKGCVQKYAETRIGDGLTKFPCLDVSCSAEFGTRTLETLLNPTLFERMVQQRSLEEVASAHIENLVCCPFCEYAAILPPNLSVLVCENPACMRETCRYCEEPNHIPLRCNEVEKEGETKMRTEIEDKMSDALIRKCNSCGKKFIKSDGCNKMVCYCGAIMCYICRKTVANYSHFNGMGGTEYHKCPLYTNDKMIHHEEVKIAANRAKAEVTARNPGLELKNDPTNFLPPI